eukprot:7687732-Pyramimonas_sp.AAC.1
MASAVSVGAGAATLSSSVCGSTEKLMSTVACDGNATRPRDITASAEHQRKFHLRSRSRSCLLLNSARKSGSNNDGVLIL